MKKKEQQKRYVIRFATGLKPKLSGGVRADSPVAGGVADEFLTQPAKMPKTMKTQRLTGLDWCAEIRVEHFAHAG